MTQSLPPKNLVLYADDDSDDLLLIRDAFSDFAAVIDLVTFADGVELLHYLDGLTSLQPKPCLIILDINMPRVNGKEILKQIRCRTEYEEVPVVLFSTSTLPSEAAFARSQKAGFVTKPIISGQVRQIAEDLLAHCSDEVRRRINRR